MSDRTLRPLKNPILDREHAAAESRQRFTPWLAVGHAMTDYGADLFRRALSASGKRPEDLVMLGSLYRHVLVAADGCLLCLEHGAVDAATVHLRDVVEGSLSVQWAAQDVERWARQYYVASLRQQRVWARRAVPGTPEADENDAAWVEGTGELMTEDDAGRAQAGQAGVDEIDRILAGDRYRETNAEFDAIVAADPRHREPSWYGVGTDGVSSVDEMAQRLKRRHEYLNLYKFAWYYAHGSLARLRRHPELQAAVLEPVRRLQSWPFVFTGCVSILLGTLQHIIELYRPAEMEQFRRTYEEQWQGAVTNSPNITDVEPIDVGEVE